MREEISKTAWIMDKRLDSDTIAKLIKQYRTQTISAEDRFLLEKEALDDPFLFDTLEGITLSNDSSVSEAKVAEVRRLDRRWLVAASMIGLLMIGWYMFDISTGDQTYAVNEDKASEAQGIEKVQAEAYEDQANTVDREQTAVSIEKENKEPQKVKPKPTSDQKRKGRNSTTNPQKKTKAQKPETSTVSSSSKDATQKDLMLEEASDIAAEGQMDLEGEGFDIKEESKPELVDTETQLVKANRAIPAQAEKIEKSEVIGVSTSEPLESIEEDMADQLRVTPDSAYPAAGARRFLNFIKRNKNIPLEAFGDGFRGEVEVKFTIKPDGTLEDFEIVDTKCQACGEEVIRLLKKGGKWYTTPKGMKMRTSFKTDF